MASEQSARNARLQQQASVPPQTQRRIGVSPADRIVRQVEGIDAWNIARRMRAGLLEAQSVSRDTRMEVARQLGVARRTHDAIARTTARALALQPAPLLFGVRTAVLAHRHAWFADRLTLFLGARGVTVVECTDNGPDALGVVVAEQPDVVITGGCLAMMTGDELLAEVRLFAPSTLRAAQVSDEQQAVASADVVFLSQQPPADVADALAALIADRRADQARA